MVDEEEEVLVGVVADAEAVMKPSSSNASVPAPLEPGEAGPSVPGVGLSPLVDFWGEREISCCGFLEGNVLRRSHRTNGLSLMSGGVLSFLLSCSDRHFAITTVVPETFWSLPEIFLSIAHLGGDGNEGGVVGWNSVEGL